MFFLSPFLFVPSFGSSTWAGTPGQGGLGHHTLTWKFHLDCPAAGLDPASILQKVGRREKEPKHQAGTLSSGSSHCGARQDKRGFDMNLLPTGSIQLVGGKPEEERDSEIGIHREAADI